MRLLLQFLCFVLVFAEVFITAKPQSESINSPSHPMHQEVNENNIPRSNMDDSKIVVDNEDGAEENVNQIDGATADRNGTEENEDNTETAAEYKGYNSVESESETENQAKGDEEETSGINPISSVPESPTIDLTDQNSPIEIKEKKPFYFTKAQYDNLVNTFKLAGVPYIGTLKDITDVITAWTSKPKKSIWDQIKSKVSELQRKTITDYHISSLEDERDDLNQKLQSGHHLVFSDVASIASLKSQFFPNHFKTSTIAFSEDWVSSVIFYIMNLATAYMEMMRPGRPDNLKIKACDWYRELGILREDIIQASKQMHKLRYQHNIKGFRASYLHADINSIEEDTLAEVPRRGSGNYHRQATLGIRDEVTNGNHTYWLPHIKSKFLDVKLLNNMKEVVGYMRKYYNDLLGQGCQANLGDTCKCPKELTEKDVSFKYPAACFGKTNGYGLDCLLPCLTYYKSSNICPCQNALKTGKWTKDGATIEQAFWPYAKANWDYCTPLTQKQWDHCMPVLKPLDSQYENRNYLSGMKKKKKKNKNVATKQKED